MVAGPSPAYSQPRLQNPTALAVILCALAAAISYLAEPRGRIETAKVFLVTLAFLITLMGLGVVFGKTLGDFLRNVNG